MNKILLIILVIAIIAGIYFAFKYLGGVIVLGLSICIAVSVGTGILFIMAKNLSEARK